MHNIQKASNILFSVDRESRYISVIKTNLMHYLSSVCFFNQLLHVSGKFVAHHQEVYCIYTTIGMCYVFQLTVCWPGWDGIPPQPDQHSTEQHDTYQLLYIYSIPPDDGLQICPKHVEVDLRNKLRTNNASNRFLLHRSSNIFVHNKEFRENLQ